MGNSRYNTATYSAYADRTNLRSLRREEVFKESKLPDSLNPTKIEFRESCDSSENPNSVPIILGLDVTGSMGYVAEKIAKEQLPKIMTGIYEQSPVSDPHLMFMGIGDHYYDNAPLQVSQFEAGALPLIEQLRSLYLESGGGGNGYESYHLPWWFALHKTKIDSYTKRGERGFIFTMGDEKPPSNEPTALDIFKIRRTSDDPQIESIAGLLKDTQEKYRVFHLFIEETGTGQARKQVTRGMWTELLGPNVLYVRNIEYLPDIIIAAISIASGADLEETIRKSPNSEELYYAFENALDDD